MKICKDELQILIFDKNMCV